MPPIGISPCHADLHTCSALHFTLRSGGFNCPRKTAGCPLVRAFPRCLITLYIYMCVSKLIYTYTTRLCIHVWRCIGPFALRLLTGMHIACLLTLYGITFDDVVRLFGWRLHRCKQWVCFLDWMGVCEIISRRPRFWKVVGTWKGWSKNYVSHGQY